MEAIRKMDFEVSRALLPIEKKGSLPFLSFGFNELAKLSSKCAVRASKRIEHYFFINEGSSEFYVLALQEGLFKTLYKDVLDSLKIGKCLQLNTPTDYLSEFKNQKHSKVLAVFLIDKITKGKYPIKGFEKSGATNLWLSAVFERDVGFDFVDVSGEKKKTSYSRLKSLGYAPVANSEDMIRKICKDELNGLSKDDVMLGNVIVSNVVLPSANKSHSEMMLERAVVQIISDIPDVEIKKAPVL